MQVVLVLQRSRHPAAADGVRPHTGGGLSRTPYAAVPDDLLDPHATRHSSWAAGRVGREKCPDEAVGRGAIGWLADIEVPIDGSPFGVQRENRARADPPAVVGPPRDTRDVVTEPRLQRQRPALDVAGAATGVIVVVGVERPAGERVHLGREPVEGGRARRLRDQQEDEQAHQREGSLH